MDRKYLWRTGLAIAVVGAASVGAIGIASASDEIGPAARTSDDGNPWHNRPWGGGGPGHGGPRGGGPWGGGLDEIAGTDVSGLLHGEVVLAREGGGTQTVLVQRGTVTEVSGTGVTVRSEDGFTTSYAVNGDTKVRADSADIGSVAKDEEVVVVAPKSDGGHTATVVVDVTDLDW